MAMILLSGCTSGPSISLPNLQSPIRYPSSTGVKGPIRSPGGPFLYDQQGRVVFFHGFNAVYKHPPYELYPAPGKPWISVPLRVADGEARVQRSAIGDDLEGS